MKKVNLLVWGGAVEACLGHICYVRIATVTKIIKEVFPVTFGVAYAISLLAFRATAPMTRHTVACIIPCQRMVAFGVTHIIANFADITVC